MFWFYFQLAKRSYLALSHWVQSTACYQHIHGLRSRNKRKPHWGNSSLSLFQWSLAVIVQHLCTVLIEFIDAHLEVSSGICSSFLLPWLCVSVFSIVCPKSFYPQLFFPSTCNYLLWLLEAQSILLNQVDLTNPDQFAHYWEQRLASLQTALELSSQALWDINLFLIFQFNFRALS